MKKTRRVLAGAGIFAALFVATFSLEAQDKSQSPVFPFGAVYFRKSNPPEQDWERDHKTAAAMGVNMFRHWFMWASIENAPDRYDWRDYDRMVELEAQNHIKVVIGEAAGHYENGHIAAVEHTVGSGKTLLIGTFPGGSYYLNHLNATREFLAGLPGWAGIRQQVQSSDSEVKARLHTGAGGTYLWVVNPTRVARAVKITLPSSFQRATELWQQSSNPTVAGNTLTATIEGRNAAVVRLE